MNFLSNSSVASMSEGCAFLGGFQLSGRNPVAYSWMKSDQDGRYCNEWKYLLALMSWSKTGERSKILLYIIFPLQFYLFPFPPLHPCTFLWALGKSTSAVKVAPWLNIKYVFLNTASLSCTSLKCPNPVGSGFVFVLGISQGKSHHFSPIRMT